MTMKPRGESCAVGRQNPNSTQAGQEFLGRVVVTHVQGSPKGGDALCCVQGSERPAFTAGPCLQHRMGAPVDQATKPAKKPSKLLYWGAGAALWAVAGVMIVSSYSADRGPAPYASTDQDRTFAEKAMASARDAMKDPISVKFKDVTASAKVNCMYGLILGRNSFGAYTGYTGFVWSNGKTLIDPGEIQSNIITDNVGDFITYSKARNECIASMPIGDGYMPLEIPAA